MRCRARTSDNALTALTAEERPRRDRDFDELGACLIQPLMQSAAARRRKSGLAGGSGLGKTVDALCQQRAQSSPRT